MVVLLVVSALTGCTIAGALIGGATTPMTYPHTVVQAPPPPKPPVPTPEQRAACEAERAEIANAAAAESNAQARALLVIPNCLDPYLVTGTPPPRPWQPPDPPPGHRETGDIVTWAIVGGLLGLAADVGLVLFLSWSVAAAR